MNDGAAIRDMQFALTFRMLSERLVSGIELSRFVGIGHSYVQSTPYQVGDRVRHIDWRVSARLGAVHVRRFEVPCQAALQIVVDRSASMSRGSLRTTKLDVALEIAGGLAHAALKKAYTVGLFASDLDPTFYHETGSSRFIERWLREMRTASRDDRTPLDRVLRASPLVRQQRSLVVVLTDLHDAEAIAALRELGERHECIVLRFEDPAERRLPRFAFYRVREAESARSAIVCGGERLSRDGNEEKALVNAGIDCLHVELDRDPRVRVADFLRAREVRMRR